MSFDYNNVYMVGIGGIGMSALAQLLRHRGKEVSGSDKEKSPTVALLEEGGIRVFIGHARGNVPSGAELLIYSDAVPAENEERQRAREMKIPQTSYFEALGAVSKSMRTMAVAGTHGKTTTTGMLVKILHATGKEPTAIVGSIMRDFPGQAGHSQAGGSNFLPGRTDAGKNDLFVVEACEYHDHLLELSPEILVITNVELDHTDYFPSLSAMQSTFRMAAERVPKHGAVVTDPKDAAIAPLLSRVSAKVVDYTEVDVPTLSQIGEFNRSNARAAKAAALAAFPDLPSKEADKALRGFKGSWRRFEYKGKTSHGALVYDDYAHHPTAVAKTIEAAREKFPDKCIIVAFHPHLYSRTRDFMDDFARTLSLADQVVLAPIYAAREKPIKGITSEKLAEKISALGTAVHVFPSLHDVDRHFTVHCSLFTDNCLIITMGAGDIYKVAGEIAS